MRKILVLIIVILSLCQFPVGAKEVVVEIYKRKFTPKDVYLNVGDTVIWKNIEKRQYHNVWFKQLNKEEPDYLFPGESYSKTFNDAGEFNYECGPHPKMKGVIFVKKNK